jgi:hypothetical protein
VDSLFRNTLSPVAWTVLLVVPPAIFALYFLKLRRTPLEVPSTYLWTKVIEDLHVNSLWQRLRRSLLLMLQLLVVGLAILALLRPGWQGEALTGERYIFLLDNSASMSTRDAQGRTRLAAAKETIGGLVDQLQSDMSAMIVSFAGGPDVVQEFTNNRRRLREAIQRVAPTAQGTRIRGALELADGFANPGKVVIEEGGTEVDVAAQDPVDLYIFSDGRFGAVDGFSLGNLRPKFLPIGSFDTQNLAITALNTRRSEVSADAQQAFVQLANYSTRQVPCVIEMYVDGRLIDARQLEVPADARAGATFELGDLPAGVLEARIDPPDDFEDGLPQDDRAYAVLDAPREAKVLLVTPGNSPLELAISTERALRVARVEKMAPEALAREDVKRSLQAQQWDLVIFDQCVPEVMPAANTLFIGRRPPSPDWQADAADQPVAAPQIIDWQRAHPVLNLVELGNLQIADSLIVNPPSGGKSLIDSTDGTLLAVAPRDGFEDAVLGFEIVGTGQPGGTTVNTNWPRMHSFPNFFLNVLEYFSGQGAATDTAHRPGDPVELQVPATGDGVAVVLPDGSRRVAEVSGSGKLLWQETGQLGVYTVEVGDRTWSRFAVNLFDAAESDVRLRPRQDGEDAVETVQAVSIGFVDVAAQSLGSPVRKELWQALLLAALVVLVLEWYIYNRRVYV